MISHPPVIPIPELPVWGETLTRIAHEPLELCPDFPAIAQRHEAWWHQQNKRPLFIATANANPARPITKRLELLDKPDEWFAAKLMDLKQSRFYGDTIPNIRVDFGPAMLGGMFGGRVEFGSDTTWTHAFIDDGWSNEPDWQLREENHFWQLLQKLIRLVGADARGRYLVVSELGMEQLNSSGKRAFFR